MVTDQEYDEMTARYLADLKEDSLKQLSEASDLIAKFTATAAAHGISLSAESFEYIPTTGIVAKAPGIARALLGPIKVQRDGLLSFDEIGSRFPPTSEGVFAGPEFIFMAHPSYRRAMHLVNNWAPSFVDLFWRFDAPGADRYIVLDEDRVRINVDGTGYFERDRWHGAPFPGDVQNIKLGIVKLRPPADLEPRHISFFFADAHCLDIKWSESEGIKTFQALEIKTESVRIQIAGQHYFPARYLHAEFDLRANCFRHFDGAIQLFTEEEYLRRREADFNLTVKDTAHIKARSSKVFKINGPLQTEAWVEFCCHFFTANPLTFEYFSGAYPAHIVEVIERIKRAT